MHVLVEERVVEEARRHVRHLLTGRPLVWDRPPLAREPWKAFSGTTSAVAQVVRLFGKEVEFDQWGDMRRLTFATAAWDPLPYDFGWSIVCRPFAGITFAREPQDLPPQIAIRYVASWTHGYLTVDEMRRHVSPLREWLITALLRAQDGQEDGPGFTYEDFESFMMSAHKMSTARFVDLYNLGDDEEIWLWQLRRGLVLLRAMCAALEMDRDLVALGY